MHRPAANLAGSTSLISGGKSVAQMFIFLAMSSVTTLTTKPPARRMLRAVSLGISGCPGRLVTPTPTMGGSVYR